MIKQATIDKIFDAARVEEVIGDFVQLKKSGSNFKGLSPFSDERTPSFMVSPVKQIWKDFSSGKGGNAISFIMEHEHFNYPEALKYLAKRYGIEVEETEQTDEQKEQASERESMYVVTDFADKFFQNQLLSTEKGKAIGLSYFKERGFTRETIKEFGLGYSPDEWSAFTDEALRKQMKLEYLEKTGLTVVKRDASSGIETKKFDRFKGRVMFPIHSMAGRVLGFGGRILGNAKNQAKYLNSPESDIYHKSKVLYGIYQAKQSIAKEDRCYLVEGYTDVIQLHQSGIENVVSSSGTALTTDQIRLISRLTQNITVLFDGDAAGLRASMRGIDMILEQDLNVKVCTFPEGDDPDSFAKNHEETEIREFLEEKATDFIKFKASLLMEEAQGDPIKKSELTRDIMKSVAVIPNEIRQEIYLKECSKIMDVSERVLYSTLAQLNAKAEKEAERQRKSRPQENMAVVKEQQEKSKLEEIDPQYELERNLISLLLIYGEQNGEFVDYILIENEEGELELETVRQEFKVYEKIFWDLKEDLIKFTNSNFQAIFQNILNEFKQKNQLKIESFISTLSPDQASEVSNILMQHETYELHNWERKNIFVKDKTELEPRQVSETIWNLKLKLVRKKIANIIENLNEDRTEQNTQSIQEVMRYKHLENLIARKLNRVL
jgi:DNA primase